MNYQLKGLFMKKKRRIFILVVCCTLVLSACAKATEAPLTQATMDVLYTSVAQTLAVSMPTVTPPPTMTFTPAATATKLVSPTAMLATPTPAATTSSCDNSLYVSDVTIPDNTVMTPGQTFTKTWSIKNSGTCNWTTSYKTVFLSGNAMSGVSTAISSAVSSGHADNMSVSMVAPTTKGTYTGYWILQNAAGKQFGASFYVSIVVSTSVTATPTGTITPTPNLTATYDTLNTAYAAATSYAQTPTPTATPIPATATPADTETPTPTST
jgi:hypothetical protein